uniref:Uncharacterized protein n=1 Tax=Anguilla anguilla TaxID=7936 RepID=A0A0E9UMU9_ANGAN
MNSPPRQSRASACLPPYTENSPVHILLRSKKN